MKKSYLIVPMLLVLACSSIVDRRLAQQAYLNPPLGAMKDYPLLYRGDLYLMGGLLLDVRKTEQGLLFHALAIPVNRRGFLRDQDQATDRFLALLPAGIGGDILDYRTGMYVTIAAAFVGVESVTFEGIKSSYPLFEIRDIHLWGGRYTQAYTPPPGQGAQNRNVQPEPFPSPPSDPSTIPR